MNNYTQPMQQATMARGLGGGLTQIKDEERRPYVACEIDSLNCATGELAQAIDELEKRLGPITLPSPLNQSPPEKAVPEAVLPPLAEALRVHRRQVELGCNRIRTLIASLEI